jgi:hypothetical protein
MVRRMLMKRSPVQPRSRKTPRGGRTMAKMILMRSLLEKREGFTVSANNNGRRGF